MLFIDFSSAFNTIIPQQLINKLNLLGLNNSLCNWILDFLTGRPQSVRVGHNTSSTTTLSTGAPQGCVLSPLLFTLLTHDCTAKFSSNHIIKFADDTTVVGLISNNDETHYREEVAQLAEWCGVNNLSLNVEKTKELVMDFRRNSVDHPPLTIDSSTVERVSSTKFLGCTSQRISPGPPTPCHSPRRHNSAYTFSAGWKEQVSPTTHPQHILQGTPSRVCWPAASLSGTELQCCWPQDPPADSEHGLQRSSVPLSHPSWHFPCTMLSKTNSIVKDPTHPSHSLFQLLPSGRRYRSIRARSARLLNSFFPPGCESPELKLPRPPLKPHAIPYLLKHGPSPPPPSKHPPTLPHQRTKCKLFCAIQVCYTQVSGPVQTTCSNTLSSMH